MSEFQAIILGIVEGITEFLPISSTAHLEWGQALMGIAANDFTKSFTIAIQAGAILAVLILYFRKIFSSPKYFLNICIAFIPTGVIGFALYKAIKQFLLGNILLAAWALLLGGVVILIFERHQRGKTKKVEPDKRVEDLSLKELLSLGVLQALAVIPGVSRSGAVIVGGRMLGLPAELIAEFSFVLAIPTMLSATAYDLLRSGFSFGSGDWSALLIGFLTAFAVALLSVKWLINYLKRHTFEVFGWYRIAVGAGLLVLLLI